MRTILIVYLILSGIASQYAPGVMENTIKVRQSGKTAYTVTQDISQYQVFVATEDCSMLGKEFYLIHNNQTLHGLVVDCSGHIETSAWMKHNNIVCEVDYNTAKLFNSIGKGFPVELRFYRKVQYLYD